MRFLCMAAVAVLVPIQSAVADISWYLGAGGGATKLESTIFGSNSGFNSALGSQGFSVSSEDFSDSPSSWQIFGGVMFNENFGLVVKYSDSGEGEDQWSGSAAESVDTDMDPNTPPVPVVTTYSFDGKAQVGGFTIYAAQTIPFAKRFEFTIEGGLTRQSLDFAWTSNRISGPPIPNDNFSRSISDDEWGWAIGSVLRYKFVKHFAMSGEVEYLATDFDGAIKNPVKYNVNLEFHF
jgi:hypothetical protein